MEKRSVNDMFVILSDVWLDDGKIALAISSLVESSNALHDDPNVVFSTEKTIGKLQTVLDGFEDVEVAPSLFVFMGNFCSRPCNLSFHSYNNLR